MKALLALARPATSRIVTRGHVVDPRITFWMVVAVIVALLATNAWLAIEMTTAKHEARRQTQAACAAEARELVAKKPILRYTIELADRCAYLRRLQGQP